jgi:hypothetical protein
MRSQRGEKVPLVPLVAEELLLHNSRSSFSSELHWLLLNAH